MGDLTVESTARDQADAVRRKEVSAREVLAAHLAQIERCNPEVNAVVTLVADRAAEEAAAADERLVHGEEIGPLHGLPVAHKDTHDTAGIRTTYGSPLLADNVPTRDALVVERIRSAGAITIGKTNVPEFAAGSHTVNPVFGATRNPYDLGRSAGGSSGGAAAALACGMHALADGSDMGGSMRNPASFCNVVGLRPSPGRVPMWPSAAPWSAPLGDGADGPHGLRRGAPAQRAGRTRPARSLALDTPGSEFAAEPPTDVRRPARGPGARPRWDGAGGSGGARGDREDRERLRGARLRGRTRLPRSHRRRRGVPDVAGVAVRAHLLGAARRASGRPQGLTSREHPHRSWAHRSGRRPCPRPAGGRSTSGCASSSPATTCCSHR